MEILDLFAGKGEERRELIEVMGHKYTTLDIDHHFGCTITADIMDIHDLGLYDFIWASVPCETWSVAAIGTNWLKDEEVYQPKTEKAVYMILLVEHTLRILNESARIGWVMENPRGILRKMPFMQEYRRQTITYCQYGEQRMKPTDIWTCGLNWKGRPMCKRGDPCHDRAPRGAKTGTQGIKGASSRSIVPWQLWEEIIHAVESDKEQLAMLDAA